ncbi:hypothetical protein LSAT2_017523, partial [Lamellibrachia satsuma]
MRELLATVRPSPAHEVEFMSELLTTVLPSELERERATLRKKWQLVMKQLLIVVPSYPPPHY